MFPVFVASDRGSLSGSNLIVDSWLPLNPQMSAIMRPGMGMVVGTAVEMTMAWALESENVWTRHWELDKLTMCQALIGAA